MRWTEIPHKSQGIAVKDTCKIKVFNKITIYNNMRKKTKIEDEEAIYTYNVIFIQRVRNAYYNKICEKHWGFWDF